MLRTAYKRLDDRLTEKGSAVQKLNRLFLFFVYLTILGCSSAPKEIENIYSCHIDEAPSSIAGCKWFHSSEEQMEEYSNIMTKSLELIVDHLDAPEEDGGIYNGQIAICIDRNGDIDSSMLRTRSGHTELDKAFMTAVKKVGRLPVPEDPCLADRMYFSQLRLFYDHNDMVKKADANQQ